MVTAKLCGVGEKFATIDLQNLLEEFPSALEKLLQLLANKDSRKLKILVGRLRMALLNAKARLMRNDWLLMNPGLSKAN